MTGQHLASKKRVDDALEVLRTALNSYVSKRMEAAFGKDWRSYTGRGARAGGDGAQDLYALLKTILDNWREVFSGEERLRKARSYLSVALDARNKVAHFEGELDQREALRYLDAALEVLRAIGATGQEEVVQRLYDEQQHGHASSAQASAQSRKGAFEAAIQSPSQSQADRIREFARERYIEPVRTTAEEITVRAGDVHKEMGLTNALPAVCSAIGSRKFGQLADVELLEQSGPANGANVYFRFRIGKRPTHTLAKVSESLAAVPSKPLEASRELDFSEAMVLVSCVKSKRSHAAPARDLYTSAWFRKVRDIIEERGAPWFILSSRYGLVEPNAVVDPYEFTLNTLGVADRRLWAAKVLEKLLPATAGYRRVVFFAGERYREFLVEPLLNRGLKVDVPMAHLARGEQLAWLSRHG